MSISVFGEIRNKSHSNLLLALGVSETDKSDIFDYCLTLLGAQFIPEDRSRMIITVVGKTIRSKPNRNEKYGKPIVHHQCANQ